MTVAVEIAAPHIVVISKPEPKGAENQEPENQPESLPDLIFQDEAITEQKLKNHILKRKLKIAVAVANGCHQVHVRRPNGYNSIYCLGRKHSRKVWIIRWA